MSNEPDPIIETMRDLIIGIVARLNKLRALGITVRVDVQRAGGPTRSFDNGAAINFTITKL